MCDSLSEHLGLKLTMTLSVQTVEHMASCKDTNHPEITAASAQLIITLGESWLLKEALLCGNWVVKVCGRGGKRMCLEL